MTVTVHNQNTIFCLSTDTKPTLDNQDAMYLANSILYETDTGNSFILNESSTWVRWFPNNQDFYLELAKGNIPGHSFIHKFGYAPDYDQGDGFVTVHGLADNSLTKTQLVIQYSATAVIDAIISSNNGDTQDYEIQGLDGNYNIVVQTITITGQTEKALDTPLLRVFRVKNMGVTNNAGHIYVYENTDGDTTGVPDTAADIRAIIHAGDNQTHMAVYTIPNGKTGYMTNFYLSTHGANKSAVYDLDLFFRSFGGVFQLKHTSSSSDSGTSHWGHTYKVPEPLAAKTDVEIQCNVIGTAVTAASVSAGFSIILVDD